MDQKQFNELIRKFPGFYGPLDDCQEIDEELMGHAIQPLPDFEEDKIPPVHEVPSTSSSNSHTIANVPKQKEHQIPTDADKQTVHEFPSTSNSYTNTNNADQYEDNTLVDLGNDSSQMDVDNQSGEQITPVDSVDEISEHNSEEVGQSDEMPTIYGDRQCPICTKQYIVYAAFEAHCEAYKANNKCCLCSEEFGNLDLLKKHAKENAYKFWCCACVKKNMKRNPQHSKESFAEHIKRCKC